MRKGVYTKQPPKASAALIKIAREHYADKSDNDLEIDDDARVSRGDNADGCWVSAWVWIPDDINPHVRRRVIEAE